jgi:DNA-binding protein H-NS
MINGVSALGRTASWNISFCKIRSAMRLRSESSWSSKAGSIGICSLREYRYSDLLREMRMAKTNLALMSVDELLKLRDDVGKALSQRTNELQGQLSRLGIEIGSKTRARKSALKGRKVPPKYRGSSGETWAGRGARPRWLVAAIKEGKKLENFLIDKSGGKGQKKRRSKR